MSKIKTQSQTRSQSPQARDAIRRYVQQYIALSEPIKAEEFQSKVQTEIKNLLNVPEVEDWYTPPELEQGKTENQITLVRLIQSLILSELTNSVEGRLQAIETSDTLEKHNMDEVLLRLQVAEDTIRVMQDTINRLKVVDPVV